MGASRREGWRAEPRGGIAHGTESRSVDFRVRFPVLSQPAGHLGRPISLALLASGTGESITAAMPAAERAPARLTGCPVPPPLGGQTSAWFCCRTCSLAAAKRWPAPPRAVRINPGLGTGLDGAPTGRTGGYEHGRPEP
jgi:hypothetical protein